MILSKYERQNLNTSAAFSHGILLTVYLLCIFLVVYLNNITQIQIPAAIYLFVTFLFVVNASKEDLIVLLISFIPLTSFFQYKYAILIITVGYYLKSRNTLIRMPPLLFLTLLMLQEFFHFLFMSFLWLTTYVAFQSWLHIA